MDTLKSRDLEKDKSLLFKYVLATSSCLYACLGCACLKELLLAVRNDSTRMLCLGEQELASKDRNTSETSSEHPIL